MQLPIPFPDYPPKAPEAREPKVYKRKPVKRSELNIIHTYYTKKNLPGEEVADMVGRTYGAFRLIVHHHPWLKKRNKNTEAER